MTPVQIIYNNTDNTVDITLSNGTVNKDQPLRVGVLLERMLLEDKVPFEVKIGYRVDGQMVYA